MTDIEFSDIVDGYLELNSLGDDPREVHIASETEEMFLNTLATFDETDEELVECVDGPAVVVDETLSSSEAMIHGEDGNVVGINVEDE